MGKRVRHRLHRVAPHPPAVAFVVGQELPHFRFRQSDFLPQQKQLGFRRRNEPLAGWLFVGCLGCRGWLAVERNGVALRFFLSVGVRTADRLFLGRGDRASGSRLPRTPSVPFLIPFLSLPFPSCHPKCFPVASRVFLGCFPSEFGEC